MYFFLLSIQTIPAFMYSFSLWVLWYSKQPSQFSNKLRVPNIHGDKSIVLSIHQKTINWFSTPIENWKFTQYLRVWFNSYICYALFIRRCKCSRTPPLTSPFFWHAWCALPGNKTTNGPIALWSSPLFGDAVGTTPHLSGSFRWAHPTILAASPTLEHSAISFACSALLCWMNLPFCL